MTSIQIIAAVFGLFMMYLTFLHYKRKEFTSYQLVIWLLLWSSFVLVTLMPGRFDNITQRLGIARAFDLFAIFAFVVILFLTFHNYLLITRLEKRLEDKVRANSLDSMKKDIL